MIVIDVQTGERYEFIINRWLAPEKEDGEVERLVQVAGEAEKKSCKHLIVHTAGKHIKENHLWFSIFIKSPRSRFSRLERTQCAFALVFLSMVVDGMWYGFFIVFSAFGGNTHWQELANFASLIFQLAS